MPLKVSDGIGAWIKDFKKSDAPQFKGKSEKERRDQAIAAYLSAKRGPQNEETPTGKQVKQAIGIARDKRYTKGNMTGAVKAMDKINPKLSGHPKVKGELQKQNEEFVFKVDVEGLPSMFMKGNSPGEVKTHLRKLVKQPSMVKSVERQTKHDVKKQRRKQAQVGEAVNEGGDQYVATSEPSKFGKGHRAVLKRRDGKTSYVSQASYKTPAKAKAAADHYGNNMHLPTMRLDRIMRDHEKQHAMKEVKSADVKPEKYIGPDGKTKIRMVPVTREAMNRRDRLRARLRAVGKDMEKTNVAIKKAAGIQDKPKVRLGSDGKPYKSRYEEVDPARDEGKPGAVKHAKKMTPGQQDEKITIGKIRKMAYKTGKMLGDVQAVKKKKVGKRVARRVAGKVAGRALGKLFR